MNICFSDKGFTLIEIMVVVVILGILTSFAAGEFSHVIPDATRKVQQSNLKEIQSAIDKYYGDRGRYPKTLTDLTDSTHSYFRVIPIDPVTGTADWEVMDKKSKKWFRTAAFSYKNAPALWDASLTGCELYDIRPRPMEN